MKKGLFQLQYELDEVRTYTENGADAGAKLYLDDIGDEEVRRELEAVTHMGYKEALRWLGSERATSDKAKSFAVPFTTHTPEALEYRLSGVTPQVLFVSRPLHTIERLDEYLYTISNHLPQGAYMWCHAMTAVLKRKLTLQRYPWGVAHAMIAWDYLWHRVCPKLKLTRRLYFFVTKGKERTYNRVEILGRLYRAGFEVVDEQFRDGEFFVIAHKEHKPVEDTPPSGSPLIHLRRIGLGGKEIVVHKFRTMYTYSEYIQPYIYRYQSLERGGKFKNDYRVNTWGRILRRTWLDELPMLWNVLRGDLKLVGVRPLSRQYYNLYSDEMQQLRIKAKPGMLPPFYYERKTPETLDEVQESERRYLEAYLKRPFATDWKYFWGIIGNILFNRKHSA